VPFELTPDKAVYIGIIIFVAMVLYDMYVETGSQEFMTSFVRQSTCQMLARISSGGLRIMASKWQCCGLHL